MHLAPLNCTVKSSHHHSATWRSGRPHHWFSCIVFNFAASENNVASTVNGWSVESSVRYPGNASFVVWPKTDCPPYIRHRNISYLWKPVVNPWERGNGKFTKRNTNGVMHMISLINFIYGLLLNCRSWYTIHVLQRLFKYFWREESIVFSLQFSAYSMLWMCECVNSVNVINLNITAIYCFKWRSTMHNMTKKIQNLTNICFI